MMNSYVNGDQTQLSKIQYNFSRVGENQFVSRPINSVTPPPSPNIDVEDYGSDDERPPHSYVCLVILALLDCPEREATIRDIYARITRRFPYYRENRNHWKNSVRHNLTVFNCFQRVEKPEKQGRSSFLWRLVGDYKAVLEKEEALSSKRRAENGTTETRTKKKGSGMRVAYDRSKWGKGKKFVRHSKMDLENAKKKKRDKKKKTKTRLGPLERLPLAEFNFNQPIPPEYPPLQSRMPTPPPRLPGIDNLYLPSPSPTPIALHYAPYQSSETWVPARDYDADTAAKLSFNLDDIANFTSDLSSIRKFEHGYDANAQVGNIHPLPPVVAGDQHGYHTIGYTTMTDIGLDLHRHQSNLQQYPQLGHVPGQHYFYQNSLQPITPESSPNWSDNSCPSGYSPPSTNTNIWELVEPESDGMMALLTHNSDLTSVPKQEPSLIKL